MANTKTLTGSGIRGYTIEFYLSEDSTSIENNTSTISYSLKIKSNNYSYAEYGTGYSIYINGTRVAYLADNGMDTSLSAHSSLTLKTGTTTVTHNNDGTKTVNVSASVSMPEGSYGPGDMSCSGTWDLTTIPRASSMTLPSSFTINSSGSITIQMASSAFSHTITYSGLGLSGTVATLNAGVSSASWTPTTSFYQKLPNSTSGTVTLTLTTKSGSTTIGTKSYDTTIVVPTSIKPTAPSLTLSPVNTNAWISSKGLYVGGYSKVRVRSSASPGSGASVSSYSISGAFSGTGADFTSSVLSAGSKSITVTVTDSRGRSNSATTSVTFLSYTYPGLTTFTALRGTYSGGSWTTNVNGDHIRVEAVPSVALSANGNTASVTVKIGNTNPSATSGNYYYFTSTNATTSYTITGSVSDSVGNSTSRSLTVPTIEVPLNINVDLPGIGVGMIAQSAHRLEVAPAWSVVADGKQNTFNYLPYSWRTTGENSIGWLRIATINILDTYYDSPIEFLVQRRRDGRSVKLSVMFATGNTSDPALSSFYYDDISGTQSTNRFQAFMYKTATSTWDVYVHESGTYDSISVSVIAPYYAQRWGSITYSYSLLSSVPSGAVMAAPVPCLNPTVTITKTGGNSTASGVKFYRSGNVCHLSFNLATSAATSAGSNVFTGTTNAPVPVIATTNASYYGATTLITDIGATGNIIVRVNGASLASGSNAYCNVVYLTSK